MVNILGDADIIKIYFYTFKQDYPSQEGIKVSDICPQIKENVLVMIKSFPGVWILEIKAQCIKVKQTNVP